MFLEFALQGIHVAKANPGKHSRNTSLKADYVKLIMSHPMELDGKWSRECRNSTDVIYATFAFDRTRAFAKSSVHLIEPHPVEVPSSKCYTIQAGIFCTPNKITTMMRTREDYLHPFEFPDETSPNEPLEAINRCAAHDEWDATS